MHKIISLQNKAETQATTLKDAFQCGKDTDKAVKRLRQTEEKNQELESGLNSLHDRSSRRILVPSSISAGGSTHFPNSASIISNP